MPRENESDVQEKQTRLVESESQAALSGKAGSSLLRFFGSMPAGEAREMGEIIRREFGRRDFEE